MCVIAFEFKNNEPLQIIANISYDKAEKTLRTYLAGDNCSVFFTDKDGRFWSIKCEEIVTVNVIKYETD